MGSYIFIDIIFQFKSFFQKMNLQKNHLQGSFQGMKNYLKFDQIQPFLNILHNKLKNYYASSGVNLFNHAFFFVSII
jgi:hypothetical protein